MNPVRQKSCPILAQVDLSTLEGQTSVLLERIATPGGFLAFALGIMLLVAVIPRRRGFDLGVFGLLFVLSFPLHYATLMREMNTLIPPLQALRSVSRPVAYALLAVLVVRALIIDRGDRERIISPAAAMFLSFQLYYVAQMTLFDNFFKGALSSLSVLGMFFVFSWGLGREMHDLRSARNTLKPLAWLAIAFIFVNIVQLVFGFGASFGGGRFLGTAGNAQFMGGMCCIGLITTSYFQTDPESSPLERTVCMIATLALAAFLIASGSRGNTLAAMAGLLAMHRARLGKIIVLGIVAALGLIAVWLLLGDEASGAERLLSTENTRAAVWARALRDFQGAPLFGSYSSLGSEAESFGVESSLLRALALLGLVGGSLLVLASAFWFGDIAMSWRLSRARPEMGRLCDFHIGLSIAMILVNVFEGIAFGVLTLPVMVMYFTFALGAFLREQSLRLASEPQLDFEPSPS